MMNRKGASTMTGVIVSVLLVMALFYGGFDYIISNYESSNITDELGYSDSRVALQTAQDDLTSDVDVIKTAGQGIAEADGSAVGVAWNGLSGIAGVIRLFFGMIDIGIQTWNAIIPALSFLPSWVKLLMELAIIVTLIFVIVGAFKGEAKT